MLAGRIHTSPTEWFQRIKSEYLELPGPDLTRPQAPQLWGLDPMACERLRSELIDSGFLTRTSPGTYLTARHEIG